MNVTVNEPDRVVVEADGPGILTLSQVYYPGWRASIDGRLVSIRAMDSLTGVQLSAGRHTVEFVFAPWTVWAGLLVSGIAWGSLLAFGLIRLSSFVSSRWGQLWNRVAR